MNIYPLVSVIIPAYNAAEYIEQAIESVLAQTYIHFELLVVDDGSTDRTPEIVRQLCKWDQRITLLQQTNSGVAAARNLAIAHAKGEFIAPLDADDIWYPQKLEKQVNCFLHSEPTVGLVYAWSVFLDETGTRARYYQTAQIEGDVLVPLIFENFIGNASSPLIRRSCLNVVGNYDCHYKAINAQGCEDWDLYLRIAEHYQVRVVPELLVGYRQVVSSMSFNLMPMKNGCKTMITTLALRHPDIPPEFYQWSIAHFDWYLALKCWSTGSHLETLRYLYDSVRVDKIHLLHPVSHRVAVFSAANILLKPITVLFWRDHLSWRRFYERYIKRDREIEIASLQNYKTQTNQRLLSKAFDQFLNRRIAHIEQLRQGQAFPEKHSKYKVAKI